MSGGRQEGKKPTKRRRLSTRDLPDRDSPEAVILLARLARVRAVEESGLSTSLVMAAAMSNVRLPAGQRVDSTDPRLREPFSDKWDLVKFATTTLVQYGLDPEDHAAVVGRTAALMSLRRYFVWCHGLYILWTNYIHQTRGAEGEENGNPLDDAFELGTGPGLHWLTSLLAVIDGWEALGVPDPAVNELVAAGGSKDSLDSPRNKVERARELVHTYRRKGVQDEQQAMMTDAAALQWAVRVHTAIESFFRQALHKDHPVSEDWIRGNVTPQRSFTRPIGRQTIDELTAREELMAVLLEPTKKRSWERYRWLPIEPWFGRDPSPWVAAVLHFKDEGILGADESMFYLFESVVYSEVGLDDAEVEAVSRELEEVEARHGMTDDIAAAEKLPEWRAVNARRNALLNVRRAEFLRACGAREAAALLDESYEAFSKAYERGDKARARRWLSQGDR